MIPKTNYSIHYQVKKKFISFQAYHPRDCKEEKAGSWGGGWHVYKEE